MAQQSGEQSNVSPLPLSSGNGREPGDISMRGVSKRSGVRQRRQRQKQRLNAESVRTSPRRPESLPPKPLSSGRIRQRSTAYPEAIQVSVSPRRLSAEPPVNPFLPPSQQNHRTPQLRVDQNPRRLEVSPSKPPSNEGRRSRRASRHQTRLATPPLDIRQFKKRSTQPPSQVSGNRSSRRGRPPVSPLLYGTRLLILGIGLGAIAGTLLSVWDPATRKSADASPQTDVRSQASLVAPQSTTSANQGQPTLGNQPPQAALQLSQEITALKAQVQQLVSQNPKLQPGVFLVDLDTGAYLDWEAGISFSAASTIKLPILVAFFQDVDQGKIRLDEPLTIQPAMIASGSGELQYKPPGTKYTALETATKMITISDNTATNMLIARLGGAEALNQRFRSWGMTATTIHNALPDLTGTNITTPKELAQVLAMINQGNLISMSSRDRMLDIMRRTVTNTLLPQGLGTGATIAHKTGDIGSMLADVGLIDMPNGKRYIAVVMVKRPHNDAHATDLIRKISRITYKHFRQPASSTQLNQPDANLYRGPESLGEVLPKQPAPTAVSRQLSPLTD